MNRFDCMTRLAARLRDELVVLSLGASVDEWYNAAPHMRNASLFQQQLGCVQCAVAICGRECQCAQRQRHRLLGLSERVQGGG